MMLRVFAGLIVMVAAAVQSFAIAPQEKTTAEAFLDITGKTHYPLEVKDAKAVVLIFVTTDCPISNYYTSEINALVKDYAGKPVRFFVIHVDPDLKPADAAAHAKTYGLDCTILIDAKHRLVKTAGVTITPEAAVLTPDGKIVYRGRIDDVYAELGKRRIEPDQRDLREALSQVLAGQAVKVAETKAVGCPIPKLP
ncbi:MAG TPA: redoxin family protein [Gemmataceae bacterium]|nr:redoxin family protein [Gemmataceae bacterium]